MRRAVLYTNEAGEMLEFTKPRPAFKVWLETDDGYVFGPGVYSILRKVEETGTLKEAARSLGMSYRFAWGLVKKAEETLGQPLISSHKGGRTGGGGAELSEVGHRFLEEFSNITAIVSKISSNGKLPEGLGTRNLLDGFVTKVETTGDKAEIELRIEKPAIVRLTVPKEIIDEQNIGAGSRLKVEVTLRKVSVEANEERKEV